MIFLDPNTDVVDIFAADLRENDILVTPRWCGDHYEAPFGHQANNGLPFRLIDVKVNSRRVVVGQVFAMERGQVIGSAEYPLDGIVTVVGSEER